MDGGLAPGRGLLGEERGAEDHHAGGDGDGPGATSCMVHGGMDMEVKRHRENGVRLADHCGMQLLGWHVVSFPPPVRSQFCPVSNEQYRSSVPTSSVHTVLLHGGGAACALGVRSSTPALPIARQANACRPMWMRCFMGCLQYVNGCAMPSPSGRLPVTAAYALHYKSAEITIGLVCLRRGLAFLETARLEHTTALPQCGTHREIDMQTGRSAVPVKPQYEFS